MLIDQGVGVVYVWYWVIQVQCEIFQVLGNLLLVECVNDLCDLEKCVLWVLFGDIVLLWVFVGVIVVVWEIIFFDFVLLVDVGVVGLCMVEGGVIFYVVIFVCSKGLLCLVVFGVGLLELEEGWQVVLDVGQGWLEFSFDV